MTSCRCARLSGWAMSRTCRMMSASETSSSVARNAATSSVGSSLMKPTVSDRITRRPEGRRRPRMVGSRVANSWSCACTEAPVSAFEQGGLAGIGVAHQRDHRERHPAPRPPMQPARTPHLLQVALEAHDALADQAPVGLDLGLAGSAQEAEAAALPLEMGPRPHQSAALILQMRELDLQGALPGGRPLAEDVEDQSGAVDHLAVQRALQVALLHRAQPAVDDRDRHLLGAQRVVQRIHLPAAEQGRGTTAAQRQDRAPHHHQADRRRQAHRLLEPRLRGAGVVVAVRPLPGQDDGGARRPRTGLRRSHPPAPPP